MPETPRRALGGPGVLLVVAYGLLALAATGRSVLQILSYYDGAPLAYTLSALAALVYLLATWCLVRGGRWVTVGKWACTFELVGVLVVGTASFLVPDAFPDKTVWSHFGQGYGFVPLVLPVLGLLWFRKVESDATAAEQSAGTEPASDSSGASTG
jgi:drug/metabolite transporter (DMT)-like permease